MGGEGRGEGTEECIDEAPIALKTEEVGACAQQGLSDQFVSVRLSAPHVPP